MTRLDLIHILNKDTYSQVTKQTNNYIHLGAQEVKALKIKCENFDNGCQWVGELRSLVDHKAECDYVLVPCPNECGSNKLQRKDLDSHKANECPKREYQCPLCDKIGPHKEQTTTHLTTCPKVMVQCPNNDCGEDVLRFMLESHRSECEYERTPCKFAKFGCELEAARKDMKAHEGDDKLHLQSTKEKVLQLIEQLEKQEEITKSLSRKEYISPITFKVTKCTENKTFRSPDFYSSKGRYMLYIRLMSKENETLDHDFGFTVILCGKTGENDHFLTWPIKFEAEVQLLNQLEDNNHKTPSSHFNRRYHSFDRYDIRRSSLGTINSKSISRNCQYLKDDTLIFRVTIQESTEKPWLKCIV